MPAGPDGRLAGVTAGWFPLARDALAPARAVTTRARDAELEEYYVWLTTPQPDLGDTAPMEFIDTGDLTPLQRCCLTLPPAGRAWLDSGRSR